MGNRFDQLGKKIAVRALTACGLTVAQHEIPSNARHADLRHEPDPARQAERDRLGLLGRIVSVVCLIEIFSGAPDEEDTLSSLGKLIAFRQQRLREAGLWKRGQRALRRAKPPPPLVKPFLWIITAGRPTGVLSRLGAVPAEGWPPGVYFRPGEPLDGNASLAELDEPGGLLRVGLIVASELRRDRSTLLVRLMAGGAVLPAALDDLAALPAEACEHDLASKDLLELRQALGNKLNRTTEEENFIVSTQDIVQKLRNEGRKEGRDEGRKEGRDEGRLTQARVALRRVLVVRELAPSLDDEARINACMNIAMLERWLDQALVAETAAEALNTKGRAPGSRRRGARSS